MDHYTKTEMMTKFFLVLPLFGPFPANIWSYVENCLSTPVSLLLTLR